MTLVDIFPSAFTEGSRVPYIPDLTLWYHWHRSRRTMPAAWRDYTVAQVAQALGVSAWIVERPWHVDHEGVAVVEQEVEGQRVVRYETPAGVLTAAWSLGPDGDWWQTEYPVKTAADLPAALAVIGARRYVLDAGGARGTEGQPGILALELPMRPYSDLLHTMLGWGEGLMLLKGEGAAVLQEMLGLLEERLAALADQLAALPGDVLLAPDNLDGQYISPRSFREYLGPSYRRSAETAHTHGKRLIVHAGGPARRLLPLLAEARVDMVEGVAPPPQGDASLAEARAAAGPDLMLWGGIPQDYLLAARDQSEFETAVSEAARQAAQDSRAVLGVADRVPVDADLDRLQAIPRLIETGRP